MLRSLVVLALAAAACGKSATNAAAPAPVTAGAPSKGLNVQLDPNATVATVAGTSITAAELGKVADPEIRDAQNEFVNKVYETRKQALDRLVIERIIDAEAKERDTDRDSLLKAEIDNKIAQPDEKALKEAYEKFVKPRAPGVTFEQAKERIADQLTQQDRSMRAQAYFQELREKYKVKVSLPLPEVERVQVAATGPSFGPENAKVTIVEFSDFECPFCSRGKATIDEVKKAYGDKVRVVFRHFPLSFHQKAPKAAEASLCAHEQGKFWQMHDALFDNQDKLDIPDLKQAARAVGVDGAKFDKCLDDGAMGPVVQKDMADGSAVRVNGTPAFFINGRMLSGAQPFEAFKDIIDAELTN